MFICILTYIWSTSLCKITQLLESEIRPMAGPSPIASDEPITEQGVVNWTKCINLCVFGIFYDFLIIMPSREGSLYKRFVTL